MANKPNDKYEAVRRSADNMENVEIDAPTPHPAPSAFVADHDPDLLAEASAMPSNDFGCGQRFALHFGDDLIFVPRVGWYDWSGKYWALDPDNMETRRKAQKIGRLILEEIPHLVLSPWEMQRLADEKNLRKSLDTLGALGDNLSDDQRAELSQIRASMLAIGSIKKRLGDMKKQHRTFARSAGNTGKIDALQTEAAVDLSRSMDDLDQTPLDVNTEAGVLRFSVSGGAGTDYSRTADFELIPHAREQLLTKIMPVKYDAAATCPLFDAFISRIQPDIEMRQFLQRWLGLSMTGLTGEQKLVFFYGNGANGKSVLVEVLARLMGDYSATAKIESLVGKSNRSAAEATPDLMPLMGARMVRASEPERGEPLQEGKIKELTGGEPILVRALQKDFVELKPQFKLTISGNHKPDVRGTDDGIWRRLLLVPFDVQIPKAEQIPFEDMVKQLCDEGPGVLNWLVTGLIDYLESGLQEPKKVIAATDEYRTDSDPLGTFLASCTVVTGDSVVTVRTSELVQAFHYWQMEEAQTLWKPTTVSRQLADKAKTWRHPKTGIGIYKGKASLSQYHGLTLAEPFKTRFQNAPRDHNGKPLPIGNDQNA